MCDIIISSLLLLLFWYNQLSVENHEFLILHLYLTLRWEERSSFAAMIGKISDNAVAIEASSGNATLVTTIASL